MDLLPWCLLALSGGANAVLIYFFFLLKSGKGAARYDASALDLLHDLTRRGAAILKVEVIDPSSLMLRSPRL